MKALGRRNIKNEGGRRAKEKIKMIQLGMTSVELDYWGRLRLQHVPYHVN